MHKRDSCTDFLPFQARYSIWTISVLVQRCFTCSWKSWICLQQTQTSVYALVYAVIYEEKYRLGKNGTVAYTSHPFYRVTLKKEKCLFFFFLITFSQQVIMWESECLPFKIKVSRFFRVWAKVLPSMMKSRHLGRFTFEGSWPELP